MKWLEYLYNVIGITFVIASICVGCLCMGAGYYTLIEDVNLINQNIATDIVIMTFGYVLLRISVYLFKSIIKEMKEDETV